MVDSNASQLTSQWELYLNTSWTCKIIEVCSSKIVYTSDHAQNL